MKSETRIYRADVVDEKGGVVSSHLVSAAHPDRVTAHIARRLVSVRVASQQDILDLRSNEVETIAKKKAPKAAFVDPNQTSVLDGENANA